MRFPDSSALITAAAKTFRAVFPNSDIKSFRSNKLTRRARVRTEERVFARFPPMRPFFYVIWPSRDDSPRRPRRRVDDSRRLHRRLSTDVSHD